MATINGTPFNDNNTVNGVPLIFRSALVGTPLNDVLNGGAGADIMEGGSGDDIYYVDNADDVVKEGSGEGTDKVYASVTTTLSANVEHLTLIGTANIDGTGNEQGNSLFGNVGNNVLKGLAGDDHLSGGRGADTLIGGTGNDTYYGTEDSDVIIENAGEGYDHIITSVDTILGKHIERLSFQGTTNAKGTGNELDNGLFGNVGNNVLKGLAGNDHLSGGRGADTLIGGTGNDTYYGTEDSDVIIENADEGYDHIITSADTTLGKHIERLSFQGTTNAKGTGNELDNGLFGNVGNNVLRGLAGDDHLSGGRGVDTLIGGTGNDTYYADSTDIIKEEVDQGNKDTVITGADGVRLSANVERLYLQGTGNISGFGNNGDNSIFGNYSNNRLFGNAGNDYIQGTGGNNYLHGGQGNDTLVGANGNDTLVGINGNDTLIGNGGADKFTFFKSTDGVDQVKDFSRGQGDTIEVVAAGFGGGLAKGMLSSDQFVLGSSARDANDRFLYKNGVLSFDADGVGRVSAVRIATLSGDPTLRHSDIFVI